MTPSPLHKLFILSILAIGLLTTVATSQPRWDVTNAITTTWQEDTETLTLQVNASQETLQSAQSLVFELVASPVGPNDGERIQNATWTLRQLRPPDEDATTPTGEPITYEKPLTWIAQQGTWVTNAYWSDLCPSAGPCTPTFTLTRAATPSAPTAKIEIRASLNGKGDEPKDRNFTLAITP